MCVCVYEFIVSLSQTLLFIAVATTCKRVSGTESALNKYHSPTMCPIEAFGRREIQEDEQKRNKLPTDGKALLKISSWYSMYTYKDIHSGAEKFSKLYLLFFLL